MAVPFFGPLAPSWFREPAAGSKTQLRAP